MPNLDLASLRTLSALACALAVGGCNKNTTEPQPSAPPAAPAAAPTTPAPSALPPSTPTGTTHPNAGGLTWTAPAPFVARAPKSSMRAAEYGIEGDSASELGVFYFGADQGGSVEDNMKRWIGQFRQPDGSETKAKRSERTVKGLSVALVEATGEYSGGMAMPGAAPPQPLVDAMLLAAIAKGPSGPVFFKLVGPRAQVEHARAGFEALVESLQPAP